MGKAAKQKHKIHKTVRLRSLINFVVSLQNKTYLKQKKAMAQNQKGRHS